LSETGRIVYNYVQNNGTSKRVISKASNRNYFWKRKCTSCYYKNKILSTW